MDAGKRAYYTVVAAGFALLFLTLDGWALLDPDEARFARTSVEMMRSGDIVIPTFEGVPRIVKPPLIHWIQVGVFRALGAGELQARLHAAASTFLAMLIVASIARRRYGEEGAAWAAAIYLTMPLVFVLGHVGTIDALLSVHVLAAIALDLGAPSGGGAGRGAAFGALLGFAFLAKGPVGVLLALVILLAGRAAVGQPLLPAARTALGFAAAWSLVVLPWGLAFMTRLGGLTAIETIRREVLERAVEGTAHVEPPWYYAKVLPVAFLPWAGPLLVGVVRAAFLRGAEGARSAAYAGSGLIAGLLFFSLSKGKLPNYILPLAPLAAIVVTWELGQEIADRTKRHLGTFLVALTLVVLAVALGGASVLLHEAVARTVAAAGAVLFGAAAAVALVGVARRSPRWTYGAAAVASAAFLLATLVTLRPMLESTRTARPLVRDVAGIDSGRPVVLVDLRLPSLTYYADRIPENVDGAKLPQRLEKQDDALYVFHDDDVAKLSDSIRMALRPVGASGKYRVFEAKARK